MNQLVALLDDREVGTVTRTSGRLRFRYLAAALPDHLADAVKRLTASGITHKVIDRLTQTLPARAAEALTLTESIA